MFFGNVDRECDSIEIIYQINTTRNKHLGGSKGGSDFHLYKKKYKGKYNNKNDIKRPKMPLTRTLNKVGNSLKVTIPSQFAEYLDLIEGSKVSIALKNNKIVFAPVTAGRQTNTETGEAQTAMEGCGND
ncbi:hypothetical protein BHR79_01095 [Methanohalophilus halophilus]|uniref:AbrB/MazE/SpoVT family DNA-binding domain-containing protein n=2 Tax=Methanohalophilus halophilus TaxID=2177 RepID=A0A1L3Q043_9EURY|nr:hypothetical protein BHR79_01095 [Methanohalophilus halophilus]RNI10918.1 AbrB/MazE/SpoVT family DNA-binding domain-containing protein [Methanohalophilus halophilus]